MIDFYSDTTTRPGRAMREAVLTAEVGDEQRGLDPSTNALQARVAELLGHEAALFLPSGTMCNEIALRVHCTPGDEVICEQTSHIVNFESGGPAALSGVMIRTVEGDRGRFDAAAVAAAIRPPSRYFPASRLLCLEQTANLGGGAVWPLEQMQAVVAAARNAGLAAHMDGARLLNACAATGIAAATYGGLFDSCWIDFSKGLGAPVGAVLAGPATFIEAAWRFKQQWGGALRQSGVLAAMCLYALDHNVDRLAEDNALAAHIGQGIGELPLVAGVLPVDSNIVIFDIAPEGPTAAALAEALAAEGILICEFGERRVRVVTHLDVDGADGDRLVDALSAHLGTPWP
ncbi:MAG: DegT/DnrJ/EryC1/StrS family aminotransferase [Hyphomicrobiales bacterium]|nr:DegT/DnrJ/EryC1/StrS family aminotransferase [Hyphomicrobiales bacterium]MCP5371826.1 DegT/DnrJ/EryC1/StrS family aminotransferase [Hyphomicrobiales bacterium]